MKERNMAIDMAKGISLLTLPAIHSTLFYSSAEVFRSLLGTMLALIAENLGAPLFLLTMGWSISLGAKKTPGILLKRSLKLFLLGYVLNLLKFGIPALWRGIPVNLFLENNIPQNSTGVLRLLLIGDILQLAGISYLVCGFLYRLKGYAWYAAVFFLFIVFGAPHIWQFQTKIMGLGVLDLINGLPPDSFFPLFPWGAYPLMGLVLGSFGDGTKARFHGIITLITGAFLLAGGLILSTIEPESWKANFYRLGPGGTCIHLGAAISVVGLFILSSGFYKKDGPVIRFLTFLGRNVTVVYMIQWVVVCWALPVFGFHDLPLSLTLIAILINTGVTILLSFWFTKWFKTWKRSMI